VLVVIDQFTRRLIGLGIHGGEVNGIALCRMFNRLIAATKPPRFKYHQWQATLHLATIRRESLDQTLFWFEPYGRR